MVMNITKMIIDRRTNTPTDPTMIDALFDPSQNLMSDLAGLEGGAVVSEDPDVHGITGQNLSLFMGDFDEHPK